VLFLLSTPKPRQGLSRPRYQNLHATEPSGIALVEAYDINANADSQFAGDNRGVRARLDNDT
jgi:hypothetical protein